jgi:hypothetical protein
MRSGEHVGRVIEKTPNKVVLHITWDDPDGGELRETFELTKDGRLKHSTDIKVNHDCTTGLNRQKVLHNGIDHRVGKALTQHGGQVSLEIGTHINASTSALHDPTISESGRVSPKCRDWRRTGRFHHLDMARVAAVRKSTFDGCAGRMHGARSQAETALQQRQHSWRGAPSSPPTR